jgi:endonuclease/exonuclease/phosphatase (EEP) superfamily protein YafD
MGEGHAATDRRRRPWRLAAFVMWVGLAAAMVQGVLSLLWRDDLSPRSEAGLATAWIGFAAITFAYHAGVAMLLPLIFAMITRRRVMALIAAGAGVMCAGPEVMVILAPREGSNVTGVGGVGSNSELTLMSANLLYGEADPGRLLAKIDREQPDVLLIQEWTSGARAGLAEALRERFAHMVEAPREDAFGQAVFSKRPFVVPPRLFPPLPGFRDPHIVAEVEVDGRVLRMVNVHVMPPVGLFAFGEQRRTAAQLSTWASQGPEAGGPHVLIGDFNAVWRSPIVRSFTTQGFREAHAVAGRWRGSTWPRFGVLAYLPGVRIDHAIVGPDIRVVEARTGGDLGSDHKPLIVRIGWRTPVGDTPPLP